MHSPLDFETKNIIEQTLRRFLVDCYDPAARHARLKAGKVDYLRDWALLAELGVLGLPFGEDLGGLGGAAIDVADAIRVLAGGLVLEPFIESAVVAGALLAKGADARRRVEAVSALVAGDEVTVLMGTAPRCSEVCCSPVPGGYQLAGKFKVVPYGCQADNWLVVALDEAAQPHVFLVPASSREEDRVTSEYRLMDSRPATDVDVSGMFVSEQALWLKGDSARIALRYAGLRAASAYCADAVGVMENLLEITGEYLRTRIQFGAVLGSFQALQHRYANMYMELSEARAVARHFAASLDTEPEDRQLWLRFAAVSVIERAARLVGQDAIQLHGGMGVTDELIVSHYNARLMVILTFLRHWVSLDSYVRGECPSVA
ncbi:acyl-CoA dehydrogenase family protein [Ferribacterium limneticum]|uniref:acyl-CoA dehydrogenase family protein n=1 Tax=Ferribacterium limneticum TaxID=76259 RepID=UPI001CF7F33C|nr:acyl-CoA dehydrogenase family protein [Ferribacterium limneticum]UCV23660.1 acyl-CoA dehydrogenase family protein [Ferribacterium limneticum]